MLFVFADKKQTNWKKLPLESHDTLWRVLLHHPMFTLILLFSVAKKVPEHGQKIVLFFQLSDSQIVSSEWIGKVKIPILKIPSIQSGKLSLHSLMHEKILSHKWQWVVSLFSLLISLSFTFQSRISMVNHFYYSSSLLDPVELEWQLKWLNVISSVVFSLDLKSDRTIRFLSL